MDTVKRKVGKGSGCQAERWLRQTLRTELADEDDLFCVFSHACPPLDATTEIVTC